jgi:hypothetical protein
MWMAFLRIICCIVCQKVYRIRHGDAAISKHCNAVDLFLPSSSSCSRRKELLGICACKKSHGRCRGKRDPLNAV